MFSIENYLLALAFSFSNSIFKIVMLLLPIYFNIVCNDFLKIQLAISYKQGDSREPHVFGTECTRASESAAGGDEGHWVPKNTILVEMEQWTLQQWMFAYDAFVRYGESVTEARRLTRTHFNLGHHDRTSLSEYSSEVGE